MINVIEYYQFNSLVPFIYYHKLPLYKRNSNFIYLYMIMSKKIFLIEFC